MSNGIQLLGLLSLISVVLAQRPGYAGSSVFGYPVIVTTTTTTPSTPAPNDLGNRFGNDLASTMPATLPPLPLEVNGDRQLFNTLSQLPRDQQPFWLLNWQALQEHRQQPQTFAVRANGYIDYPMPRNGQGEILDNRNMYFSR